MVDSAILKSYNKNVMIENVTDMERRNIF